MAHVVGVPRRDPCRKCQLPVFLAERLLVGKKVYHRTCLKCARCSSQLTPGSFYETEVDEQYCCETCPDEEVVPTMSGGELAVAAAAIGGGSDSTPPTAAAAETSNVQLRNKLEGEAALSPTTTRSVRSSIRDRLAFFEQKQQPKREDTTEVDSKLLQKSLSDEEKSKSLQRMENSSAATGAAAASSYKMNPALTSFLNDTVDNEPEDEADGPDGDEDESESLSSSVQNSKMETSDSEETDDLTSVSLPPELPKTLPPSLELKTEKKDEDNKRFTASAQLILESTATTTTETPQVVADEQHNIIRASSPEKQTTELQISVSSSRKSTDKTNNNLHDDKEINIPSNTTKEVEVTQTPETMETIQQIELEKNNLACNETNDNDCVTKDKDKATVDVSMETETETEAAQQLESTTTPNKVATKSREPSVEKLETSESVKEHVEVELRTKSPPEDNNKVTTAAEDKETTQRLSVVRARLQQFEVITNNEKEKEYITATNVKEEHLNILDTPTTPPNANEPPASRSDEDVETKMPIPAPREETMKMDTEIVTESLEEKPIEIVQEVPLIMETKDNEILENKNKSIETPQSDEKPVEEENPEEETGEKEEEKEDKLEETEDQPSTPKDSSTPQQTPGKVVLEEYPEDLNPFKSDEEDGEEENKENLVVRKPPIPKQPAARQLISVNPFDSSDDEVELEKSRTSATSTPKIPPPRPPPPRISRNPFGSDDEDEDSVSPNALQLRRSSLTASQSKRTPVPTPRSNVSQSLNPTPEPTPRLSTKITTNNSIGIGLSHHHHNNTISSVTNSATTTPQSTSYVLQNSSDFYGSANSLHSNHTTPNNLLRNSDIRSSNNSLNLSAGGTIRSRKSRRAPLPPAPVKELFPSSETINSSSKASTPSSSTVGTPKSGRKKRPAPAPPKPARLEPATVPQIQVDSIQTQSKNLHSYPLQSELDSKLSDEEKALLEGKTLQSLLHSNESDVTLSPASRRSSKRMIHLDKELMEEHANQSQCDDLKQQQHLHKTYHQEEDEANVVYRRLLIPHNLDTPTHESNPLIDELNNSSMMGERQLEKLKDNKEANNRNRQSQISAASSGAEDNDPLYNKSVHGKWKRRKGPAPALPIPPRKVLQMLPLQEIKHELDIIEVQQQGLEKQGVVLEKMIRDRCEGENGEPLNAAGEVPEISATDGGGGNAAPMENSKEVEYLILQLFELVNEKNELFRRQAELMYLRRQHRLEQEQADLEYEIRVLMAQPERNKTDSDKAREEAFIERLVEVVQLRNEVVECLEMDRIREAEEDQSIKQRLESHIAKRDDEPENKKSSTSKLSKKEKKKQKESKKLVKNKKLDADKDADESEINLDKQKTKKKKKLLIF